MTCTETAPGHHKRTDIVTLEVAQDSLTPNTGDIAADPAVTHHTGHSAHIAANQTIAIETAAEHITAHQTTALETTVDHQ